MEFMPMATIVKKFATMIALFSYQIKYIIVLIKSDVYWVLTVIFILLFPNVHYIHYQYNEHYPFLLYAVL